MGCMHFCQFWIIQLLTSLDVVYSCGLSLSGRRGEIKTPNYSDLYEDGLNCTWTITVEENHTITIKFWEFELENECVDHFRIYDGPNSSSDVLLDTCKKKLPQPVISSGSRLLLTFTTDESETKRSVHLVWRVSDKFTINLKPSTWIEANAACIKEGSHLAVQTDVTEVLFKNLLSHASERIWMGDYFTPWVWLKGCYKGKEGNITSSSNYSESKHNQFKVCQYKCKDSVYFGLQNRKCFCLTTEDMEDLEFSKTKAECNMPCPGKSNEKCGGDHGVSVYMNDVCWKNSSTWTGRISRTISGRTCQSWKLDSPHDHPYKDDHAFPDGSVEAASNYCRDPDGKGAPWCYTTDPAVSWQFCDVPPCAGTCWKDPVQYAGSLNKSIAGFNCLRWTLDSPAPFDSYHDASSYPDRTVKDASNYCRSPSGYPALWCFVEEEIQNRRYDYCGSPPCFEEVKSVDTGELCRVYGVNGNKFFYKEQSCSQTEQYACFKTVQNLSSTVTSQNIALWVLVNTQSKGGYSHRIKGKKEYESFISKDKTDFYEPWSTCSRDSFYGISDYKLLFGLMTNSNIDDICSRYWLGNFRTRDNVKLKDTIPTPSACKTLHRQEDRLRTDIQPNCDLKLDFVCQKEVFLCGETFSTDEGKLDWPVDKKGYDDNEHCLWEINVSVGRSVEIFFHNIDIEESKDCCFDSIEISDISTSASETSKRLCGKRSNITFSSSSNKISIVFTSDKDIGGGGFQLEWTSELIPTTTDSSLNRSKPVSIERSPSAMQTKATNRVMSTSDYSNDSLEGGAIAGMVIGALLIIVIAVVLALVVRRRYKTVVTEKQEPDVIFKNEDIKSDNREKDVYSTPIPKDQRGLKQKPSSEVDVSGEPENNFYDHLKRTSSANSKLSESGNVYGKLQKQKPFERKEMHCNTLEKKSNQISTKNRSPESGDYEYDHLHHGPCADDKQPVSDNLYGKLQTEDTYDHGTYTSFPPGDIYSHVDQK